MYTAFEITNFRCFDHLKLDNLARVNLIAGKNNVGKTALLEALFIHCGAYKPTLALRVSAFRSLQRYKIEFGPWGETPWDSLFKEFDSTGEILLSGSNELNLGSRSRSLAWYIVQVRRKSQASIR